MSGIITGFAIIGLLIVVGYFCARGGLGGPSTEAVLNKLSFFVAMPALIFTVVAETPLRFLFGAELAIQSIIVVVATALFLLGVRLVRAPRLSGPDQVVGSLATCYVNSNNMGLPIAIFVLGNPRAVVPVLLLNLLVLAPIGLMLLDAMTAGKVSWKLIALQPIRNPIILGSVAGALVSASGVQVPPYLWEPLRTLGGAAIPMMLMAFGMSLLGARPLRAGPASRRAIVVAAAVKSAVVPALAFVLARFVFGLDQQGVLTAVVIAALPTAQNVYNYAARYSRGEVLARDTVLLTTAISPAILFSAAALLG